MYLHLGQSVVVRDTDVIGIFDLDNTTGSYLTREYLEKAEKAGRVVNVSEELPKSFVVCQRNGVRKVFISQLSSQTLLKRWEKGKLQVAMEN